MGRRIELHPIRRLIACVVGILSLVTPATAEKRVALIIGNAAYAHAGALANPANDAKDMAASLTELGFNVILGLDLSKAEFDSNVREFSGALADADTAVFFYAGHGLQVAGRNYLVPVDAELKSERDLDFDAVGLDFILKQMELGREGKTNIVFLDACRDNPLARNLARSMGTRSASIGKGLAEVQTGVGTFVAYSTQPGNVALDGAGRNSPFTAALAKAVRQPGHNLTAVMIGVRKQVLADTGGKQVPWDHSALVGDFFFNTTAPPDAKANSEATEQKLKQLEEMLKAKADQKSTVELVKLENMKERVRQLTEANREDQQRIFDVYRSGEPSTTVSQQVGKIQIQMARRGQEMKRLTDDIEKLEPTAAQPAAANGAAE
ncbi:MAG: caspase family protein [Hyphomicrobium sp.]